MEFAAGAVHIKKPVVPFMAAAGLTMTATAYSKEPAVAAANAATQAKATARDSLTSAVRGLVKLIQAKPNVTDESSAVISWNAYQRPQNVEKSESREGTRRAFGACHSATPQGGPQESIQ